MRAELTDRTQQEVIDILSSIEDLCVQSKDIRNLAKTVAEMEEVEAEKSQADNQLDVFWSKLEMSDVLLAQRQYGLLDYGEEMLPQEYESKEFGRNANPGDTTSLSLSRTPVSGEWSVGALGNVTSSHRTGPVTSSASVSGMQLPASATTLPIAQAISTSLTTGISSLTSTTPYVTAVIQVPGTHVTAAMPVPSTQVTLPAASVRLPVNTRALPPVTTHTSASVRSSGPLNLTDYMHWCICFSEPASTCTTNTYHNNCVVQVSRCPRTPSTSWNQVGTRTPWNGNLTSEVPTAPAAPVTTAGVSSTHNSVGPRHVAPAKTGLHSCFQGRQTAV